MSVVPKVKMLLHFFIVIYNYFTAIYFYLQSFYNYLQVYRYFDQVGVTAAQPLLNMGAEVFTTVGKSLRRLRSGYGG